MITERDIGKKCRMIRTGEIGKLNIASKAKEILNSVYEIKGLGSYEYDDYVVVLRISPTLADASTSFFIWRMELVEDEELTVLT